MLIDHVAGRVGMHCAVTNATTVNVLIGMSTHSGVCGSQNPPARKVDERLAALREYGRGIARRSRPRNRDDPIGYRAIAITALGHEYNRGVVTMRLGNAAEPQLPNRRHRDSGIQRSSSMSLQFNAN